MAIYEATGSRQLKAKLRRVVKLRVNGVQSLRYVRLGVRTRASPAKFPNL